MLKYDEAKTRLKLLNLNDYQAAGKSVSCPFKLSQIMHFNAYYQT